LTSNKRLGRKMD